MPSLPIPISVACPPMNMESVTTSDKGSMTMIRAGVVFAGLVKSYAPAQTTYTAPEGVISTPHGLSATPTVRITERLWSETTETVLPIPNPEFET